MDSATARAVAAVFPGLHALELDVNRLDGTVDGALAWEFPADLPQLTSLNWQEIWDNTPAGGVANLQRTLRGRRLGQLAIDTQYVSIDGMSWLDPSMVAALYAQAALPTALDLVLVDCWTGEQLRALVHDGTCDVDALHDLSIFLESLSPQTLAPLGRLSGLTRLHLEVRGEDVGDVSIPGAPSLCHLTVKAAGCSRTEFPQLLCATLLTAAAASAARHTLTTISLPTKTPMKGVGAAAAIEALRLPALTRVTAGEDQWTFARGRIVGWPSFSDKECARQGAGGGQDGAGQGVGGEPPAVLGLE